MKRQKKKYEYVLNKSPDYNGTTLEVTLNDKRVFNNELIEDIRQVVENHYGYHIFVVGKN